MEAIYSSLPEIDDYFKRFIILSASVLILALIMWFINKQMKEENENSDIHES